MDLLKTLADLRREKEQIEEAILVFERLATGKGLRRRGRPPAWLSELRRKGPTSATAKKKTQSAAA
jgi:hypothetical protein